MQNIWMPKDETFWTLNNNQITICNQDTETEVVIIGGGIAGLSAAQAFCKKGKKVILLEQYYCGSGASGKSSGFITPNAELSLTDFANRYNMDIASQIWQFITSGVEDIRRNIQEHNFRCDNVLQDTLVVANSKKHLKILETESNNLAKLNYKTAFYNSKNINNYITSPGYFGGVIYENTFGINAYLYCQEMKKILKNQGVMIYEETPVTSIENQIINTLHAKIKAENIIVCTDRFMPDLNLLINQVYHAQTFLLISQQLSDQEISKIFPLKNFMVWDTDLIYNYFRLSGDNRLLVGGGNILKTYSSKASHDYLPITRKLTGYIKKKFPQLNLQFEYQWPGLIGISKDIVPIAGRDKNRPYIYYITASAGLPIAAALGRYSAEHLIDNRRDLDFVFSPYRSFPVGSKLQSILGTKASFAISNLITKKVP